MGLSFGKRRAVMLRLAPDVAELLERAAHDSGRSINSWVTDAIVVRLGNWEAPLDKIKAKRKATGRTTATVFEPAHFDAFGFPRGDMVPDNPRAEIGHALHKGPEGVAKLLRQWWSWNGLDPKAYTEVMLQETLRVYAAEKPKAKAAPAPEA